MESGPDKPRWRRRLVLILLVAFGLRLGWGLSRSVDEAALAVLPDQQDYLSLARNLLHGRGFQFLDKRFSDAVWAFRMPGYPLFVAACGANLCAARAVQAGLDTSTVLAIFILAMRFVSERHRWPVALAAAAIVAINPYLVYVSGLLLSETLFAAMLAWGMVLLVLGRGGRSGSWRDTLIWLAGGALLALSVLVRPSAAALPVLLGITAVFVNRAGSSAGQRPNQGRARWPLPVGATMVLLVVLALLPWSLRNRHVLGRWVWLDTNAGFTLYDGYNPDATGGSDQSFIDREPELQVLNEVDRSDYLAQKAEEYALDHPKRACALAGAKLARTWSPLPLSSEFGRPAYRLIALIYSLPFDVLLILGLVRGELVRPAKVFLLAPAIYLSIVHALTVGSLRYRLPAEGPMAIIAASLLGARATAGPDSGRPAGQS